MKEHEAGVSVEDLCRKHGVNDASIYKWKAKFGGMDVWEAKRLKTVEDENTRLKRLLACGDAISDSMRKTGCDNQTPPGRHLRCNDERHISVINAVNGRWGAASPLQMANAILHAQIAFTHSAPLRKIDLF